jgi:hypothetical protein
MEIGDSLAFEPVDDLARSGFGLGQIEARSADQGQEEVAEDGVEAQCDQQGAAVVLTDAEASPLPGEEMGEALVEAHHALGSPGRAGGEEEVSRVIARQNRQALLAAALAGPPNGPTCCSLHRETLGTDGFQPLIRFRERAGVKHSRCPRGLQDQAATHRGKSGINGEEDAAAL